MRSRSSVALLLLLATVAPAAALAQPAPAQSQEDPGAHFERGVSFFRNGDYVAAMVEFERAYKLDPKPQVLYNIGQTSRELRDYARSLKSFERYLAESPDVSADRRKQVEAFVDELRGKVARLTVVVDVAGAEVTVDDALVGRTPLAEPLVVNAGRRKIDVKRAGYAPVTRFVEIAGTSNDKLELTLDPLAAPAPAPAPPPKIDVVAPPSTKPEPASPGVGRWIGLGVTGVLGIATGVFGGLALKNGSDFDDALAEVPTSASTIDDARSEARTFAITADVLGGATIAAGITTIILFAVEGSADASATPEKASLVPLVGPGFIGAAATF